MQLGRMLIAEAIGTYLLVLFGAGAVATDVVTGGQLGLWPVGFIGGFGVTVGIYATVAISGAHLNPAISLAFALFRRSEFPVGRMVSYWGAQLAGAFAAGLTLFAVFSPFVERLERLNGYIRGAPGSEYSAMIFSKHFPDPGTFGIDEAARSLLSAPAAAAIEGFGTAILAFVIFAVFDRRNTALTNSNLAPLLVGLTVAILIGMFGPLTHAGWNPVRDFGPRIVAFFAGWGSIAIPGPTGGFWAYIVGPLVGAPIGAAVYEFLLRPGLPPEHQDSLSRNGSADALGEYEPASNARDGGARDGDTGDGIE